MVHVVEREHERLLPALDRVGHRGERQVGGLAQGERERGREPFGVVVPSVDGQPRERPRIGLQPVHEQRRLAVARGRDDKGDRHVRGLAEAAQQPLTAQGPPAQTRARGGDAWDASGSAGQSVDVSVI